LQRRLTTDAAVDLTPEWLPDGRHISFISNRDGAFHIWVQDVEHGTSRRIGDQPVRAPITITSGAGQIEAVHAWSPDGMKLGFIAERDFALWIADPDGGNARQIVSGILGFSWYRDSSHVLYTRISPDGSYTRELVARDLDSGAERILYRGPHVNIAAARDGGAVLFCYAASHADQSLFMLPLAPDNDSGLPRPAGEPRRLTDGKRLWHAHHGSFSPDGKTAVYSRDTLEADVYLIENYR
jgi:TolB protein